MYVISGDSGFQQAAAATGCLIPLSGLDEFLDFCKAQGLKPDGSARAIFAGVIGEGVMKAPWPKLVMPWNPSSSEIH